MAAFSRLHQATAIVPLALVSVAWSVSLAGTELPSGRLPAPRRDTGTIIATASASGIPSAALTAYQRAQAVINSADKSCDIPWQLIAAIGRVESDHGRFGGNSLSDQGVAEPGIYGIALNGKNNTQRIVDTDAGLYDSDTKHDRAVGPMQFIPSTWSVVGVDGDNDGRRNPQDIDDAALASAVYLCSGGDDLSTDQGQRASVYRYNHSNDYVDLVLSIMQAYMHGDFTSVPNGTTSAGVFVARTTRATNGAAPTKSGIKGEGEDKGEDKGRDTAGVQGTSTSTGTKTKPTPTTTATPTPAPTQTATPTPKPTPTVDPTEPPTTAPVPTSLPPLPSPTVTPLPPALTFAQAVAQCAANGVIDDPLTTTNELNDCANALLAP